MSMRFSRQGYWSGLPFPSLGDLPNRGIEPGSPVTQADSLPTEPYEIIYMWNLKYGTNESIYATESQVVKTDWESPKGRELREGWSGRPGLADVSLYIQNG